MIAPQKDSRFTAFVSPAAPDIFRSVLSTSDVWRPDPLDVPSIHAEARRTFDEVVERTRTKHAHEYDRLILLQGVAGSGKTHLISALRNDVHESRRAFFTYMQMQTAIPDYSRYILWNVIASLEKPLRVDFSPESGFEALSRGIYEKAERVGIVAGPGTGESHDFDAYDVAEALRTRGLYRADTHMLAALLTLQRHDTMEAEVVSRYLRCETLTSRDAKRIDFLTSREDPVRTLQQLALLIDETFGLPLVICLDQLDNFYSNEREGGKRFQEASMTLDAIVNGDDAHNIIVLVAILDDQYALLRPALIQAQVDRYELGTRPIRLDGNASAEQIDAVLRRRLAYLYERAEISVADGDPIYPYDRSVPSELAGSRLRTALRVLGEARTRSIALGERPVLARGQHVAEDVPKNELELSQQWNDASLSSTADVPTEAEGLVELLRFAVTEIAPELPSGFSASVEVDGSDIILVRHQPSGTERELITIANQAPAFGHLGRAVEAAATKARTRGVVAILVRSADYPQSPRAKIFGQLGTFAKAGHRRLTFAPGDWRAVDAYRTFAAAHRTRPDYAAWVLEAKPLTAIAGMQALLELDEAIPAAPAALIESTIPTIVVNSEVLDATSLAPAPNAEVIKSTEPLTATLSSIVLGNDDHQRRAEVDSFTLTRHAAILGGSGSGKTTLAFALIEGLLDRGIPAILLDRKGDLCWFGDPQAWKRDVDHATAARRHALLAKVRIDVFTPGANAGRNLAIAALPAGLRDASSDDRDEAARAAALGLGAMLEYGNARRDRLAILDRAIATLGAMQDEMTLDMLIDFIDSQDPALVAAIGKLKPKALEAVASDLSVLKINAKRLLSAEAEALNIERLLGLGQFANPGKTQLSIISTKALGDGIDSLFWISRLLVDLARFASRHPKPQLQAVVFFDEADRYLPATSKPITKEPMENLLKRARSGGLGVMLATQSPGDLDYKSKENIATWLVGKVSEDRAREKLEGVLGNARAVERLPHLRIGDFYLKNEAGLTSFHGDLPFVIPRQLDEQRIIDLAGKRFGLG